MKVYVDLRCLQDFNFARRGVGVHVAGVLRHARQFLPPRTELVGLVDERMPALADEHRALCDETRRTAPPGLRAWEVFLNTSPMTHDPTPFGGLIGRGPRSCAIVYDFIPLDDQARYLPTPADRRAYEARLEWLGLHSLFFPISRASAARLRRLCDVGPASVEVTGACVRAPFVPFDERARAVPLPTRFPPGGYFLLVAGGDERKNARLAIEAHGRFARRQGGAPGLVVVGHYGPADEADLRRLASAAGGEVEFTSGLGDLELAALYHRALATVSASRAEGFSLPIVEAIGCGSPVLASRIDAHRELIAQEEALFGADDLEAMAEALRRVAADSSWREALRRDQAPVAGRFAEAEVSGRVWRAVTRWVEAGRAPRVRMLAPEKPRLALLTPYPPDRSGVADYSAHSLRDLAEHVVVDVYTDAEAPRPAPWVRSFRPISDLAYLSGEHDKVLTVVGNSHFHTRIISLQNRYGGPCLMHDNRLAELYLWWRGPSAFAAMASRSLGRPVSEDQAVGWVSQPGSLPSLFFDEVVSKAEPLLVHSRGIQRQVKKRYGVEAAYLPFCCYRHFQSEELGEEARRAARARLGVTEGAVVIATFGFVLPSKGPMECIWALEQLRAWGVPAELHFVGEVDGMRGPLEELAGRLGLRDAVRLPGRWAGDDTYRDYLIGADFAVQLRTHGFGGLSGAVLDCISAGLPTVCNEDLATAMDGPEYVMRVPDHFSPTLIAEQLYESRKAGQHAVRSSPARDRYVREHSFAVYAREMVSALGLAG